MAAVLSAEGQVGLAAVVVEPKAAVVDVEGQAELAVVAAGRAHVVQASFV